MLASVVNKRKAISPVLNQHRVLRASTRRDSWGILPDAVLELLGKSPARAFIECEMGTHPIVRSDEDHTGAVMAKVRRYASYMTLGGDQPFYAQQFHNDMPAELLFLVHSDVRRASVEKHIAGWRELNRAVNLKVFALTVPEAVAHFAGRLGLPADPAQRAERAPPQPRPRRGSRPRVGALGRPWPAGGRAGLLHGGRLVAPLRGRAGGAR
jgi:hypothetical protein